MPSRTPSESTSSSASAADPDQQDAEQTNSQERERSAKQGENKSQTNSMPEIEVQAGDQAETGKRKVAVICTDCQTAYAAEKWPDGKTRLIGRPAGCQCGSTEFDEIMD
ncbi:hypothetical protein [Natrialba hulunbeirensis]|uniref:hypothetical protein n=1 Tax=Natrialba hulunbeirensis TaxID=123783 RepID=UPI000ACFC8F3